MNSKPVSPADIPPPTRSTEIVNTASVERDKFRLRHAKFFNSPRTPTIAAHQGGSLSPKCHQLWRLLPMRRSTGRTTPRTFQRRPFDDGLAQSARPERSAPRARRLQTGQRSQDPLATRLERKIEGCNGGLGRSAVEESSRGRTHKWAGAQELLFAQQGARAMPRSQPSMWGDGVARQMRGYAAWRT
jgi:hypothetical protein